MNSLIATKIKTNMRLVSTKLSILSALTYVPLFRLIPRIQQKLCWFSAIKMFECQKNTFVIRNTQCSIELSVHTQPNVFNRTYTIQSRMNSSNNYSFFILICLQPFFVRYFSHTAIPCSAHNLFVSNTLIRSSNTPLHTRLIEL